MKIKWYGHSCFLMTAANGARFLTDPCDPDVGYALQHIETDVITVSHDHHDHNYIEAAMGQPQVLNQAGEYEILGCSIHAVPTFHDEVKGKKRGSNLVFVFEIDGLRIAHLGDLGHVPEEETVNAIGPIDVLLAPIGGVYTIDADGARAVANLLKPKILIPMHYKTRVSTLDIDSVDKLLTGARDCRIHRVGESEVTLTLPSLGGDRILVLDYVR